MNTFEERMQPFIDNVINFSHSVLTSKEVAKEGSQRSLLTQLSW